MQTNLSPIKTQSLHLVRSIAHTHTHTHTHTHKVGSSISKILIPLPFYVVNHSFIIQSLSFFLSCFFLVSFSLLPSESYLIIEVGVRQFFQNALCHIPRVDFLPSVAAKQLKHIKNSISVNNTSVSNALECIHFIKVCFLKIQ